MTEEDLQAIEQLMRSRIHVRLPGEQWSSGMTKAMLDKIPELITEVRRLQAELDTLNLDAAMAIMERIRA